MKLLTSWAGALLLILLAGACGGSTVAASDLTAIVEDEGVAFSIEEVPGEILDALDDFDVVIIGESHLIEEQRTLTASLLRGLHGSGARQLLLEWPHLADWVAADFVIDGPLSDGWRPPTWLYGDLLTEIREFNRSLAEGEKLQVRGIDVNLDSYGGASDFRQSLRGLHNRLEGSSPIDSFLEAAYSTIDEQVAAVDVALSDLRSQGDMLAERWGENMYRTVTEMLEVEAASIPVRAESNEEKSAEMREAEMKRLADLRLSEASAKSVVNVGGNHAQKERLRGTHNEWIGDYLVHRSPMAAGSTVSLIVLPATIEDEDGTIAFDIRHESPSNELLRIMSEGWPDQAVFLSFGAVVFSNEKVAINIEGRVSRAVLKRHWDAVILLPVGTRIPLPE